MNPIVRKNVDKLFEKVFRSLLPVVDSEYPISIRAKALLLIAKTRTDAAKEKILAFYKEHPNLEESIRALSTVLDDDAVPLLIERVKDKRAHFRDVITEELGKTRLRQGFECLVELLADEDRQVRFQAANGLFQIGGKDAALALCKYISDPDEWISMSILRSLCIMKERESIPFLAEQFTQDTDLRRKAIMVSFLSRFRSVTLMNIFDEGIKGKDARLKANSIEAIGELELPEREIKSRIEPYLRDPNNRIRANAILALARSEPDRVRPEIVAMVDSNDVQLRRSAAFILGVIRATGNEELAARLIEDQSVDVRKRRGLSLKNFPESFIKEQLEKTIRDENKWIRKYSVEIATRLNDFPPEPILRQLNQEINYPNIVACMEFFAKHPSDEAARLIKKRIRDARVPVVAGLIRALAAMYGLAGIQKIASQINYRNPDILMQYSKTHFSIGGMDIFDTVLEKASTVRKGANPQPFFPSVEACIDLLNLEDDMPPGLMKQLAIAAEPEPVLPPPVVERPFAAAPPPVQVAVQAAAPAAAKPKKKGALPPEFQKGVKFFNLGKYKKADKAFRKALEKDPGLNKANFYLGMMASEVKDTDTAQAFLQAFVDQGGTSTKALYTLAKLYRNARHWERAVNIFEKILQGPKKLKKKMLLKISRELGAAYIFQGNYQKAKEILEMVFKKDPTNSETNYHLAMSYFKLQNYRRAESLLIDITRQVAPGEKLQIMATSLLDKIREQLGAMTNDAEDDGLSESDGGFAVSDPWGESDGDSDEDDDDDDDDGDDDDGDADEGEETHGGAGGDEASGDELDGFNMDAFREPPPESGTAARVEPIFKDIPSTPAEGGDESPIDELDMDLFDLPDEEELNPMPQTKPAPQAAPPSQKRRLPGAPPDQGPGADAPAGNGGLKLPSLDDE